MKLPQALEAEHSKAQMLRIAHYVGAEQSRFEGLIELLLHGEAKLRRRAAWAVNHCCDQHPELLHPHVERLWGNLDREQDASIQRNILRLFQDYPLPPTLWGKAATLCFDWLANPQSATAVRAHSISILHQLTKSEPDLAPELVLLLEEILPTASAGLRSRGRRVLRQLRGRRS